MRKLLIMASLFYPQKNGGGPPVSIMNIVQAIKEKFEIYIISHNYEVGQKEALTGIVDGWNTFDFGKVYYFPYGKHTPKNIYKLICEIAPDVIYQNSFFSYDDVFPVLKYKKRHTNVGVVIAPRGEICENRLKSKRLKKVLYIEFLKRMGYLKNIYFQATGQDEEKEIEKFLHISQEKIFNINNFSYVQEKHLSPIEKSKGSLRMCFIARIQETKNLLYAIERLKKVRGDIVYDIYGPIENKPYYEKCLAVSLPINIRVNYCGCVEHDKVGATLSQYHVYYMPTIGENYGHSIVESLLHGRPILISDKTPWNEVNENSAGYAVSLDNPEEFERIIEELCLMENQTFQAMCDSAKKFINEKLRIEEIVEQYIHCFNGV